MLTNVQNLVYWSSTDYAPFPTTNAWRFFTGNGFQDVASKDNGISAWAVRSGDVGGSSVPEPGILGLMGIGALAWSGTRSRRRV